MKLYYCIRVWNLSKIFVIMSCKHIIYGDRLSHKSENDCLCENVSWSEWLTGLVLNMWISYGRHFAHFALWSIVIYTNTLIMSHINIGSPSQGMSWAWEIYHKEKLGQALSSLCIFNCWNYPCQICLEVVFTSCFPNWNHRNAY